MDLRSDFPFFSGDLNKGLVYFDNAATSQRPECVNRAVEDFYNHNNANPLRGLYDLSVRATDLYEAARAKTAAFLNAASDSHIIFTRNATESLNLIAYTYGMSAVEEGDEIVISAMEHHSNILPWQMVCKAKKAKLVWLECDDQGVIAPSEWQSKITSKTKIVSIAHVSNVFGITNPVKEIASYAHKTGNGGKGAAVIIDGAQSVPHMKVDVQDIGADFLAFSGHKALGPMGIGALYARDEYLEQMPPFLRGGEMIEYVTRDSATYAELPHKFEAGTVNAGGAVGLAAALDYLSNVGFDFIEKNDNSLAAFIMKGMESIPHVHVIGNKDPERHCGIVTFTIDDVHPHDIASMLSSENVAIRAGHHCAQPLMQKLGVGSTARASVYFYNTQKEAEIFLDKLSQVRKWMGL
ncbi:SufS family cysteine desulfurase [Treponema sp.]|uniref:aminotransferase class V-fold PLP-dependent enzyme n=1 Tax=Treponema sp. TaxID=166 RepID=UPI0025EA92CC|nr:SufS family cysteine desulfurase [Treponema sp.]MCR5218090.1 SufS family cysteine desulfurase [Treponema sp.]